MLPLRTSRATTARRDARVTGARPARPGPRPAAASCSTASPTTWPSNGLVDFSLRRAAKAAGTTHKVLLYHFDGAEDLLARPSTGCGSAAWPPGCRRLRPGPGPDAGRPDRRGLAGAGRLGEGPRALDQALGLAMYDPDRHAALAVDAAGQYLPALRAMCPPQWSDRRKDEIAEMIFAALRGFLVDGAQREVPRRQRRRGRVRGAGCGCWSGRRPPTRPCEPADYRAQM